MRLRRHGAPRARAIPLSQRAALSVTRPFGGGGGGARSKAHPHYAVMRGYGEHSWFSKDQGVSYARREFGNLVEVPARARARAHARTRARARTHARACRRRGWRR